MLVGSPNRNEWATRSAQAGAVGVVSRREGNRIQELASTKCGGVANRIQGISDRIQGISDRILGKPQLLAYSHTQLSTQKEDTGYEGHSLNSSFNQISSSGTRLAYIDR